ncbi:MAG: hypothetical protein U1E03_07580 [Hyphomonadaceae bacterium]
MKHYIPAQLVCHRSKHGLSEPIAFPRAERTSLEAIIADVQQLIEANESSHLLMRQLSQQLGALHTHLDQVDDLVLRLKAQLAALR